MSPAVLGAFELPVIGVQASVQIAVALGLVGMVYTRGWFRLHVVVPQAIRFSSACTFFCGLVCIWVAVGSPLAALDEQLLSVHMVQHLLLSTFAPPLLLLGAPVVPLLRGLPRATTRRIVGPLLRSWLVRNLRRAFSHPAVCWLAAIMTLIVWHVPVVFELAVHSERLHEVEHLSFLVTGLLFWWPVIEPWPSVARWPRWSAPLYLFCATLPCDVLSAFLAFCDRVVYPTYLSSPRISSLSALADQECAGSLMWISVTFAYLAPAVVISIQLLSRRKNQALSPPTHGLPSLKDQGPSDSEAQVA
jgi:cytochrome c oxidase assembly factor CtaG